MTKFIPKYRVRVGSHRVLFEVEGDRVVIYRVRQRKDAWLKATIMIELHPEILKKNGSEFVLLRFDEHTTLQELLSDYQDLIELRTAKQEEGAEATLPLDVIKSELGL